MQNDSLDQDWELDPPSDDIEDQFEESYFHDMSDDAWVLASAGMGTDEDYGSFNDWMED